MDPGHDTRGPPAARGIGSSHCSSVLVLTPLAPLLSTGTPGQVRVTAHQRAPPAPAGRHGRVQLPPQRPLPFCLLLNLNPKPPAPAPARCESAQAGVVAASADATQRPSRARGPRATVTGIMLLRAKSALGTMATE